MVGLVSDELGGACAPRRVCGGAGRRRARRGGFAREDFFLFRLVSSVAPLRRWIGVFTGVGMIG